MRKPLSVLAAAVFALQSGGMGTRAAHAADTPKATPAIPHFIEETETAGLQSRFDGRRFRSLR